MFMFTKETSNQLSSRHSTLMLQSHAQHTQTHTYSPFPYPTRGPAQNTTLTAHKRNTRVPEIRPQKGPNALHIIAWLLLPHCWTFTLRLVVSCSRVTPEKRRDSPPLFRHVFGAPARRNRFAIITSCVKMRTWHSMLIYCRYIMKSENGGWF